MSPAAPRRQLKSVFTGFKIGEAPVPWSALLRSHNRPGLNEADFKTWRVPHPRDVIVIGVRNKASSLVSGWFVRFRKAPNQLVRLPWGVAHELSTLLTETPELHSSALYKLYPECYFSSPTDDFSALARHRFLRKEKLANYASQWQTRLLASDVMHAAPDDIACAICLEGGGAIVKQCCVAVCVECHIDKLRTLCPVCDRTKLNGEFACDCCMERAPFAEHGHQCASCSGRTLCRRCWYDFGECVHCDP